MTAPTITHRKLADHDDFMRVRQLLIDTYSLYGSYQNWEIRRWEGQWYWGEAKPEVAVLTYTHLWETASGELVAVLHIEGDTPGHAWIQSHPDYRHLEAEMIATAEAELATTGEDGKRKLEWYVYGDDTLRSDLLAERGYTRIDKFWEVMRRGKLADLLALIPAHATPPPGYTLRGLRRDDMDDTKGWADVVGATFERTIDPQAITNFQQSPSYDHDLHLVAEAPDGIFAAFAGLTVDTANRTAIFEPVGTHPDHRRKHLASHVMWEGMRRLHTRGDVDMVYVGTGEAIPANGLYDALGFTDMRKMYRWQKAW